MTDLMKSVLALTVSGTALAAALALLRRILKEKLPKAVFYYLWLLVLLRLIVPVALPVPGLELTMEPPQTEMIAPPTVETAPSDVVQTPVMIDPPHIQTAPNVIITDGNGQPPVEPPQTPWYEGAWAFLCENFAPIWLAGAAMHFLWFAFSYFRFSHGLKQDCTPLLEHEQALLDNLRGDMPVAACRSGLAQTPMLLGLLRPRIVLPETAINTRELECILRHELTHLRRRDLLYKWFTVAVTSFHWFNPLMPWLRKEISRACELSCDEGVIGAMDDEHKRLYGETLLALAAANALPRAVPATTLCEEKKQLRERLLGIKKYHKTTLLMAVLSVLLALLVAGCAAVLGPQLKKETFTGPLTEEQQAPVLENIKAWAEENIQVDGELTVTYSEPIDQPQSMGILAEIATTHLYDLSSDTIRPVDGIYPDSEQLGHMTLMVKDGETVRDIQVFYLTGGDPAKGTSPVESLEQFAIAYPKAKANYLSWEQREGQPLYIKMFFIHEGKESIFEYSGVCGRWGVRERETASDKRAAIPADALPQMMDRIIQWQTVNGGDTDGRNFTLVNGMTLETPASHGILDQFLDDWQTVQVYNMATGDLYTLEGDYTGAVEYGCFTLLNVEDPESRIFLIDNDDKDPVTPEPEGSLTGQVAVLTKNAPLDNAFAQTVDTEGRTVVMDMAMALKKGDLVYVDSQEGETCNVTVLAGDLPRVQGQLNARLLNIDLSQSNQVILENTNCYDDAGGTVVDTRSGVAQIEQQTPHWLQVSLPGGGEPFWVRRVDLVWKWPLPEPLPVWMPAEADRTAHITRWAYAESDGEIQIAILEVSDPPAHRAWHWEALSGTMVERTAKVTRYEGDLTVEQLPALMDSLKCWLDQNEPLWQSDRTLTMVHQPPTAYKTNFSKDETVLVYSLADHQVVRLTDEYTGSKNYGLMSITVNGEKTNLSYYLLIDEAPTPQIIDSASDQQQGTPDEELIYEQRPDGSVGERFILLRRNGYMGLLDGAGNQLLAPETYQLDSIYLNTYEEVWPISLVVKDGLCGAIDYNGNLVIHPQWQEVMMYCYDHPDMVFLRDGYQWYAVRLSYDRYTDVFTYSGMQVSQPFEALHLIPELQIKTAAWLEQEFHRVYDPYYDIQELIISDWEQKIGTEATFHYKMSWLNYNRDPNTVDYVVDAKKQSQSVYETLYNDYLALKEGNYSFKIVWEGDTPTLYTDVSVKGEPEWELTEVQNFVLR